MGPSRVKVASVHVGRSDLVELQVASLLKHLRETPEVSILVDHPLRRGGWRFWKAPLELESDSVRRSLEVCRRLGVSGSEIPPGVHQPGSSLFVESRLDPIAAGAKPSGPSYRAFGALQFVVDTHLSDWLEEFEYVVLLDFDVFALAPFSIDEFAREHAVCALVQSRGHVEYLWPGLVILNARRVTPEMRELLRFDPGPIEGFPCDVGGATFELVRRFRHEIRVIRPNITVGEWEAGTLLEAGVPDAARDALLADREIAGPRAELFEGLFLHLRGASNWQQRSFRFERRRGARLRETVLAGTPAAGRPQPPRA